MDTYARNRLIYAVILAAAVGYVGNEWTHRPRYTLIAAPAGGA